MGEQMVEPEIANWWPAKGGVDPHEPPPWEAPPLHIERRSSTEPLVSIEPLPAELKVTRRIAAGPRKKVVTNGRVTMKQARRTVKVDRMILSMAAHVGTLASLTIDQAMHLHFWTDDWRQGHEMNELLHDLVERGVVLTARLDYPLGGLAANAHGQAHGVADVLLQPVFCARSTVGSDTCRTVSVSSILWQIAQAYAQIYREETEDVAAGRPGRWGIWGHSLRDLVFESLLIEPHKGLAHITLGS